MVEYERTGELLVNLASDQTSLHNPFGGGYYPVQLSYNEAQKVMSSEPQRFKELVQERCEPSMLLVCPQLFLVLLTCIQSMCSLRRQVTAINKMAAAGLFFWDYGNAFLLESSRAGTVCVSECVCVCTFTSIGCSSPYLDHRGWCA